MTIRIVDKRGHQAPSWIIRMLSDADMTKTTDGFWRVLRSFYRIEVGK